MFFWYRLTRVFPDKFHRAVKRLCVCFYCYRRYQDGLIPSLANILNGRGFIKEGEKVKQHLPPQAQAWLRNCCNAAITINSALVTINNDLGFIKMFEHPLSAVSCHVA